MTLCYATTVHKSQGSEYPAVVAPVHTQHFPMLQRNLLYTAMTRGMEVGGAGGDDEGGGAGGEAVRGGQRVMTLRERMIAEATRRGAEAVGG